MLDWTDASSSTSSIVVIVTGIAAGIVFTILLVCLFVTCRRKVCTVYAEIIALQINQWIKMLCIADLLFYLIYRLVDRIWIHLLWAVVPHYVARCQEVLFLKIMVIKSLKKSLVKEVQLLPRQQILVMVSLIMNRNMNIRIFSCEPIL